MKFRFLIRQYVVVAALAISIGIAAANELTISDAYARSQDEGLVWTIGTKSIEMTFDGQEGVFRLVSFLNKSCGPPVPGGTPLEYVDG